MKTLHLFNPTHDLALAAIKVPFTPPRLPRAMERDLMLLAHWYAESSEPPLCLNAEQLSHAATHGGYAKALSLDPFGEGERAIESHLVDLRESHLSPWGWNADLLLRASKAGFIPDGLPTAETLARQRLLSHRATAVQILQRLHREIGNGLCGCSTSCHTPEELLNFRRRHATHPILLKQPYSCSGRGLLLLPPHAQAQPPSAERWIQTCIRQQGGLIAEVFQEKVCDFAMEFEARPPAGKPEATPHVRFAGYSLFETDSRGAYRGNRLLPDESIEAHISQYLPVRLLHEVQHRLPALLEETLKGTSYQGILGIDMLVARSGSDYLLLPCVELNLRMNMGMVAHRITRRILAGNDPYLSIDLLGGYFRIDYSPLPGGLTTDPAICLHRRRILTPILPDTRFCAAIHRV